MRPPARLRRIGCTARRAAPGGRAGAVRAATLGIHVQTPDGHALAGAVVTVRPLDAPPRRPAPAHAVMDQVNRAFAPDLLVIPVGSTVAFPNSDSVSHQIYSFSAAKRFQLPLYRGKPYPPVQFDQSGVITLGCNIHDDMLAYLLVTDAPYFGRTDAQGAWSTGGWGPRMPDAPSWPGVSAPPATTATAPEFSSGGRVSHSRHRSVSCGARTSTPPPGTTRTAAPWE